MQPAKVLIQTLLYQVQGRPSVLLCLQNLKVAPFQEYPINYSKPNFADVV